MEKYRESSYNQMKSAIEFLDSLPIDSADNALWWCLHQVVWHLGVDRVRWLLENKELVIEISNYKNLPPDNLREKFWESVYLLKRLNR
jgi:hypothetical protein